MVGEKQVGRPVIDHDPFREDVPVVVSLEVCEYHGGFSYEAYWEKFNSKHVFRYGSGTGEKILGKRHGRRDDIYGWKRLTLLDH